MSDNILVAVRLRSLISREIRDEAKLYWQSDNEHSITQIDPDTKKSVDAYEFDKVFSPHISNKHIYDAVAAPVVQSSILGINGTVFAYGQTSSGKTYTMTGDEGNKGIIPLCIHDIFQSIENIPEREFLLRASYMEIYKEDLYDLLTGSKYGSLREDSSGSVFVPGLKEVYVTNEKMLLAVTADGDKRRKVAETKMNERSSRSHSIFRLIIESRETTDKECDGAVTVSHLNLVDLAGSENAAQTGATGERLKEGGAINKSLSTLSRVISQLSEGESFVSFRDSKLTRILQTSLGGNARTVMICTVTPTSREQTLSTVRFASQAKSVKNKPIVNEVLSEAALLKRYALEIKKLKAALENERNSDKAQEVEQVKEKLDEKERHNMELQEKLRSLKEKLVCSSLSIHTSTVKEKKMRRETWAAPALWKACRLSPVVPISIPVPDERERLQPISEDESSAFSPSDGTPFHSELESSKSSYGFLSPHESIFIKGDTSALGKVNCNFLSPEPVTRRKKRRRIVTFAANEYKPLTPLIKDTGCQTEDILLPSYSCNQQFTPGNKNERKFEVTPKCNTPLEELRFRITELQNNLLEKDNLLESFQTELDELNSFHLKELEFINESFERKREENIDENQSRKDAERLYLDLNIAYSDCVKEVDHLKEQVRILSEERIQYQRSAEDVRQLTDMKMKRKFSMGSMSEKSSLDLSFSSINPTEVSQKLSQTLSILDETVLLKSPGSDCVIDRSELLLIKQQLVAIQSVLLSQDRVQQTEQLLELDMCVSDSYIYEQIHECYWSYVTKLNLLENICSDYYEYCLSVESERKNLQSYSKQDDTLIQKSLSHCLKETFFESFIDESATFTRLHESGDFCERERPLSLADELKMAAEDTFSQLECVQEKVDDTMCNDRETKMKLDQFTKQEAEYQDEIKYLRHRILELENESALHIGQKECSYEILASQAEEKFNEQRVFECYQSELTMCQDNDTKEEIVVTDVAASEDAELERKENSLHKVSNFGSSHSENKKMAGSLKLGICGRDLEIGKLPQEFIEQHENLQVEAHESVCSRGNTIAIRNNSEKEEKELADVMPDVGWKISKNLQHDQDILSIEEQLINSKNQLKVLEKELFVQKCKFQDSESDNRKCSSETHCLLIATMQQDLEFKERDITSLKVNCENFESSIGRMKKEAVDCKVAYEGEIENLLKSLKCKELKVTELEDCLQSTEMKLINNEKMLDSVANSIEPLRSKIQELAVSLSDKAAMIETLLTEKSCKENSVLLLNSELAESKSMYKDVCTERTNLTTEINSLQQELELKESDINRLNVKYENLECSFDRTKKEAEECKLVYEEQIENLLKSLKCKELKVTELEGCLKSTEMKVMNSEINETSLNSMMTCAEPLRSKIQELEVSLSDKTAMIETLLADKSCKENSVLLLNSELADLKAMYKDVCTERTNLTAEINSLQQELELKESDINRLNVKYENLECSFDRTKKEGEECKLVYEEQIDNLLKSLKCKELKVTELEGCLKSTEMKLMNSEINETPLDLMTTCAEPLRSKIQELEVSLSDKTAMIETLLAEKSCKENSVLLLNSELADLKAMYNDVCAERAQLSDEITSKDKDINELLTICEALKEEKEALFRESTAIVASLDVVQSESNCKSDYIMKLEKELVNLRVDHDQCTSVIESDNTKIEKLVSLIEKYECEAAEKDTNYEKLMGELENTKSELVKSESDIAKLSLEETNNMQLVKALEMKVVTLEKEVDVQTQKRLRTEVDLETHMKKNRHIVSAHVQLQCEMEKCQETVKCLTASNGVKQDKLVLLEETIGNLEKLIKRLETRLKEKADECNKLQNAMHVTVKENEKLQNEVNKFSLDFPSKLKLLEEGSANISNIPAFKPTCEVAATPYSSDVSSSQINQQTDNNDTRETNVELMKLLNHSRIQLKEKTEECEFLDKDLENTVFEYKMIQKYFCEAEKKFSDQLKVLQMDNSRLSESLQITSQAVPPQQKLKVQDSEVQVDLIARENQELREMLETVKIKLKEKTEESSSLDRELVEADNKYKLLCSETTVLLKKRETEKNDKAVQMSGLAADNTSRNVSDCSVEEQLQWMEKARAVEEKNGASLHVEYAALENKLSVFEEPHACHLKGLIKTSLSSQHKEEVMAMNDVDSRGWRERYFEVSRANDILSMKLNAQYNPAAKEVKTLKEHLKNEQLKNKQLTQELRRTQNMKLNDMSIYEIASSKQAEPKVSSSSDDDVSPASLNCGSQIVLDVQVMRLKNTNYHLEKKQKSLEEEKRLLNEHVEHYKSKAKEWKSKCLKEAYLLKEKEQQCGNMTKKIHNISLQLTKTQSAASDDTSGCTLAKEQLVDQIKSDVSNHEDSTCLPHVPTAKSQSSSQSLTTDVTTHSSLGNKDKRLNSIEKLVNKTVKKKNYQNCNVPIPKNENDCEVQ